MRKQIIHPGANQLSYEIRGIVEFAKLIEKKTSKTIFWENIGDPVIKGEKIPQWIKSSITEVITKDSSWGYSPTKGLEETRNFLANYVNSTPGTTLSPENICFFNGLGDAISKVYSLLNQSARVIGPGPAYPTHSSAEGAHAFYEQLTYKLDPNNNWYVDIEDLKNKVKYNDSIVGILIINPDNPTGMVYPKEILKEIVELAKKFKLFLISDEIYANLVYDETTPMISLREVIANEVPTIIMKGISKDVPWPGSRCGWIEFYNKEKDPQFERFCKSIVDAKMLEVCSTTLPQAAIPKIFSNKQFQDYLYERKKEIKKRSDFAYNLLKETRGIKVNKTSGAFYTSIVFDENYYSKKAKLSLNSNELEEVIEKKLVNNDSLDKRFCYYLLAKTGICVVPLSSFCTPLQGFRITFLEQDFEKFKWIFQTIKKEIEEFLPQN